MTRQPKQPFYTTNRALMFFISAAFCGFLYLLWPTTPNQTDPLKQTSPETLPPAATIAPSPSAPTFTSQLAQPEPESRSSDYTIPTSVPQEDLVPLSALRAPADFDFSTATDKYIYVSVKDALRQPLAKVGFTIAISDCAKRCAPDTYAIMGRGLTDQTGKWSAPMTLPTWAKSIQVTLLRPGISGPLQVLTGTSPSVEFAFTAPSPGQ